MKLNILRMWKKGIILMVLFFLYNTFLINKVLNVFSITTQVIMSLQPKIILITWIITPIFVGFLIENIYRKI